jgi:hypothetical protein
MARPHPLLIEVAAGRTINGAAIDHTVVDSAVEHRMSGLLLKVARETRPPVDHGVRARLEALDLGLAMQRRRLMRTATAVHRRLEEVGIEHFFFKGVVEAYRVFEDPHHRPFADIDLCLAPFESLSAATAAIAPDHPNVEHLDDLVAGGYISSVGFFENGQPLDLHTDVVRVGPNARHPEMWWEHTTTIDIPELGSVRALNREASFVVFVLHQARDRFRYLIGLCEFRRRLQSEMSFDAVRSLAVAEGVWDQVAVAISAMSEDLGIPSPVQVPKSLRARLWSWLWRAEVRLGGPESRLRHTRRGRWMMPLMARGRAASSLRWIARSAFPPDVHLRRRHPDARGPYLWRIVAARIGQTLRRRREAAAANRRS